MKVWPQIMSDMRTIQYLEKSVLKWQKGLKLKSQSMTYGHIPVADEDNLNTKISWIIGRYC